MVPLEVIDGYGSPADLQLPPADTFITEPRTSDLYVNTIGSQLRSATGFDARKDSVSGCAPGLYYEAESDPSAASSQPHYDLASSADTGVDTLKYGADPISPATAGPQSISGRTLSSYPTSRTLDDMPILRRQSRSGKDVSLPVNASSISAPHEHNRWLRPCAVCARKKAKLSKPRRKKD